MILHIKNMEGDHCIPVVRKQLEKVNFQVIDIAIGKAIVVPKNQLSNVIEMLETLKTIGLDVTNTRVLLSVEKIKNLIVDHINSFSVSEDFVCFSDFISSRLFKDYDYLNRLFSKHEGITIKKFIINVRAEKVKILIDRGQFSLNEIAFQLGYSSSAHLSSQFKKVLGISPSAYKMKNAVRLKSEIS